MTMISVTFRFFGNLNDFLPKARRNSIIAQQMPAHAAVKHPIEALGVPHPEVDAVLVDRQPVDFSYQLQDGNHVDVYPFEVVHLLRAVLPLRPPLPSPVTFVADAHLGQLACYLRLFGFDTRYRNDYDDPQLAEIAATQHRILLTRDRGLLKHRIVVHGYCVRETDPRRQLVSVLRRYQLAEQIQLWQRCTRCNGLLQPVEKSAILDRLQPKTRRYYDTFQQCDACGQIYWQGSHFERMAAFVQTVLASL